MKSILINHQRRYPLWSVDDLYKLIHQSAMGSEHAISDERHARDWLRSELADLSAGPEEPLLDPISPDGQVVRVHLRPFIKLDVDPELLLQAFILTAEHHPPSKNLFLQHVNVASQLANEGVLRFTPNEIANFFDGLASNGFPAIHHSKIFEETYRPAYRVVVKEFLPGEILVSEFRA